ncbi:MAG: MFS transporter [Eubacteriales bacterium]
MVAIVLLVLIYLAFISLGLPDSILGVAWPAVRADWGMPLDAAGLIVFITICGTVISSFSSGYFIKKFGTGKLTTISCFMTGLALLGYSFAPSYIWLLLLGLPLGLGAGAVDTGLNSYVALHYKSHHMNWLHSFWGVGSTLGPIIIGSTLSAGLSWRIGYRTISLIQLGLALILLVTLPVWKKHKALVTIKDPVIDESETKHKLFDKTVIQTKGLIFALGTFLFYCAVEISVGLWGSSYLVQAKGIAVDTAAYWVALYYASIMTGRIVSGFITFKVSNKIMIRSGAALALFAVILMILPLPASFSVVPMILVGLGLSPIFPAMIHETPKRFGKDKSQTIIGYQMGFAYIGSAIFPPLIGFIITQTSMMMLPALLIFCTLGVIFCTEMLTKKAQSQV